MVQLAPEVRSQFAKRLKTIRTQRGFHRARYFAKSLGIEENRYTRYERAEVEPSLTLIHKMCQTLGVSPNELLGFVELAQQRFLQAAPGVAEDGPAGVSYTHEAEGGAGGGGAPGAGSSASLAWSLASEAVAIQHEHGGKGKGGNPLQMMQDTSALFRSLQADPFGTVTEIVNDRALKDVDGRRKAKLAELAQAYTESISGAGPGRRRR
jgi:transcriptional regulator with XRE-family HTH domain